MAADQAKDEVQGIELAAIVREIQERVRARYPLHTAGEGAVPLADLMPAIHARDKAEGKVAAIGIVNPRPGGLANNFIQWVKGSIARGLNWFVREQVEFNRGAIDCVNALIEAVNDNNRGIAALAAQTDQRFAELRAQLQTDTDRILQQAAALREEAVEFRDMRRHWIQWRQEWERKLSINEIQFLRSVADLQSGFQHRVTLMESNFRETVAIQHKDFTAELAKARLEIQQRLWDDMQRTRTEYEKLIHNELRVVRQRAAASQAPAAGSVHGAAAEPVEIDFLRFAERFRGTEEYVRAVQQRYVKHFEGCEEVLDTGCGRGEFLESLREAGILSKGVDSNAEMIAICRAKGLYAEEADMFQYMGELDEASLDGIFCGQVVEHLPPALVPRFVRLAAALIRPGGRIVIETPNPECLAIFASHFYLDPTHNRPVPAQLLAFYLEEAGFGGISVEYVNPAADSMPSVAGLSEEFRKAFFHGLDYAITARRL
ncbi:MAG: class I SAM-dependent methyltransferase [Bryobacteraceae bacterium]|nr:class I SAM-dependent methyltransferase [Bryobacteraceae bacterium]